MFVVVSRSSAKADAHLAQALSATALPSAAAALTFVPAPWYPAQAVVGGGVQLSAAPWSVTDELWKLSSYESLLLSCNLMVDTDAATRQSIDSLLRPALGISASTHTQLLRALSAALIFRVKRLGRAQARLTRSGDSALLSPVRDARKGEAEVRSAAASELSLGGGNASLSAFLGDVSPVEVGGDGMEWEDESEEQSEVKEGGAGGALPFSTQQALSTPLYRLMALRAVAARFGEYFAGAEQFMAWAQR